MKIDTKQSREKSDSVLKGRLRALACAALLSVAAPASAYAVGCTVPAGVAGDMIYNSTYNLMQYCNGTSWVNMGSMSALIGTLTNNDFCTASGGSINCTTQYISLGTQVSGTLQAAQFPGLTGDVTTSAGSLATTVGAIGGKSVSLGGSLTTGGAFTISGAYGVTLTATNTTTLTLPTSGTLIATTSTPAQGDILYYNGTAWTDLGAGTSGYFLQTQGASANPQWAPVSIGTGGITGTFGVANGGTGDSSLTAHTVMIGEGTSPVGSAGPGTAGQLLIGQGATNDPAFQTVSGDVTIGSTGITAIGTNKVTMSDIAQVAGLSVIGNGGSSVGNVGAITGAANQVLTVNSAGNALAFGAVNLGSSAAVTGNLPVNNLAGGSGASSNTYWRGDGTWAAINLGTSGGITGTVPVGNGGTGVTTLTTGGVLYGQGTSPVQTTGAPSQYNVLVGSAGGAPVFGQVALNQTAAVTGTLPVGNGGTGLGTLTANAIYRAATTTSFGTSALSDNGTLVTSSENIDVTGNAVLTEIANNGTVGTGTNLLATVGSSGAITVGSSATDGAVGIVTGNAGRSGNAQVAIDGQAACVFDGTTVAGDFVTISSATAGDCHDAGTARSTTAQTIGRVLSVNSGSGTTAIVALSLNGLGGGGIPAGTTGQVQYNSGSNTFAAATGFTYLSANNQLVVGTGAAVPVGLGTGGTVAGATVNVIPQAVSVTGGNVSGAVTLNSATLGQMAYYSGASAISGTPDLYVSGSNIGIGTASASQPLTVYGNIDASSGSGYLTEITNSTGTAGHLAKLNGSGAAALAAISDTDGVVGIVVGTSGSNAQIAVNGQASCVFENATTAGDFVTIGTGTPGDCRDAGGSRPTAAQTIGRVLTSVSAGASAQVALGLGANAASAGATGGSGATNYVARWTPNGTTLGTGALIDIGTAVGVGTTPTVALEVNGAIQSDAGVLTSQYAGAYAYPQMVTAAYAPNGAGQWITERARGTSASSPANVVDQDMEGVFIGRAYEGGAFQDTSYMEFLVDNLNVTSSTTTPNPGGQIQFFVRGPTDTTQNYVSKNVMTLRGSGNVGIGTTGPANALDVNGSLAVGSYAGTVSGASNELIVGGTVGIGTSSPAYPLSVTTSTANYDIYANSSTTSGTGIYATESGTGSVGIYGGGALTGVQGFSATGTGGVFSTSSGYAATFTGGNVGIGTTAPGQVLQIRPAANENLQVMPAIGVTGAVVLNSVNDANNASVPLEIESLKLVLNGTTNGNVGIGTTGPTQALHVYNAVATTNTVALIDDSAVSGGYGAVLDLKDSARNWQLYSAGAGSGLDASGMFGILDATAPAWRFVIDHSGNVGIGTTSPQSELQVGSLAGDAVGSVPVLDVLGNTQSATSQTMLRLNRPTSGGNYFNGGVDFNVYSYGAAGSPYNPATQLDIVLKSSASPTDTANVTVMSLRDNGNVGIGTTNPADTLDVYGTGIHISSGTPASTSNALYNNAGTLTWNGVALSTGSGVTGGTTNYEARWLTSTSLGTGLIYDNGSAVGIGTAAPSSPLSVVTNNSWGGIELDNYYTGAGQYAGFIEQQARGTSVAPTATQSGDDIGFLRFNGYGASSTETAAQITAYAGSNFTNSNSQGSLAFSTTPSGSNILVEAMRINSAGNVGIGTTSPSGALHVASNSNAAIVVSNSDGTSDVLKISGNNGIDTTHPSIRSDGNNVVLNASAGYGVYLGDDTAGSVFINMNASAANTIINATSGNVGIGVTSPGSSLEVASSCGNSTIKTGSFEIEPCGLNNSWIADNLYYNSGWKYRSTGYVDDVYFLNGNIYFETGPSGTAGTTATKTAAVTILNGGNVGIGTTGPAGPLHIYAATGLDVISDAPSSNSSVVELRRQGTQYADLAVTSASGAWSTDAAVNDAILRTQGGKLLFNTNGGSGASTLAINGGNVGIGTASPGANLDVETTGAAGVVRIGGTTNAYTQYFETGAGADQKIWDQYSSAGNIFFRAVNDAYSNANVWMQVNRGSGYTISSVGFPQGNVGIGTTGPLEKLHIIGASAAPATFSSNGGLARFQESSGNNGIDIGYYYSGSTAYGWLQSGFTGGSSYYALNLNPLGGNVGIGTTAPVEPLETYSSVNNTGIYAVSGHSGSQGQIGVWDVTAGSVGAYLFSGAGGNAGIATTNNAGSYTSAPVNFTSSGNTLFNGNVGIGTTGPTTTFDVRGPGATTPSLSADSGTLTVNNGSDLQLQIGQVDNGGAGVFMQAKRVSNDGTAWGLYLNPLGGNVGIGTTAPQTLLTLAGGSGMSFITANNYVGSNIYYSSGFKYYANGYGSVLKFDADGSLEYYQASNNSSGANAAATLTEPFVINASGNVGIGTTNPSATLQVRGGPITDQLAGSNYGSTFDTYSGPGDVHFTINNAGIVAGTIELGAASDHNLALIANGSIIEYLQPNGNVGIGTTGPGEQFETYNAINNEIADYVYNNATGASVQARFTLATGTANAYLISAIIDNSGSPYYLMSSGTGIQKAIWQLPSYNFETPTGTSELYISGGNALLAGTLTQNSDARLKTDIHPVENALEKLRQVNGVTFRWKDKTRDPAEQIGVIAQDVEKVFPQAVATGKDGIKSVNYSGLIAPLIEAVKQLKSLFDNDHDAIARLKADNDNLRAVNGDEAKAIDDLRALVEKQGREIEALKKAHP